MKRKYLITQCFVLYLVLGFTGMSDVAAQLPQNANFSTLVITPFAIEGLTGDEAGNLYTTGRATAPALCPVWKINIVSPSLVVVGNIPNPSGCNPSGIALDHAGDIYVADAASGGTVWKLTPNASTPPTAVAFATGVPGTNGLAFDRNGNLWTGDGTTGQGRVWKIGPAGGVCEPSFAGCEEAFRIQPVANSFSVGRQYSTVQPALAPNPQPLVANGVAFNHQGSLFMVDTARGAVWKVEFNSDGSLKSERGCDTTFTPNTLCLNNILVAHPLLEGADGFVLDQAGNFWIDANERNAVVVVTVNKEVVEIFRNPPDGVTNLRNTGPLEFPTSPFINGKILCTSNSDGDRRDNSPRAAGEINAGGPVGARGKISCMEPELAIPGMPLPVSN